ncbi:MAG: radical SAM protein [bacterium]|nr:radical SAM protein [bacterium]
MANVLLVTPPFTQLNTPYPATAYLKGFLESKGIKTSQCDLSIELFNSIFNKDFIHQILEEASHLEDLAFLEVWEQRKAYSDKVDTVVKYLQNHEVTLAHLINHPEYLPKAHRYNMEEHFDDWSFGQLGILDRAKYRATIFIEELGDFIRGNIDEFFAFTKYAEQIGSSASSFDTIEEFLSYEPNQIEDVLLDLLDQMLKAHKPDLVCFTVPFPGNLFAALRCGQHIKFNYPNIKVAMGGGYCNTELRSLSDSRVFEFVDFISLDDGESPLLRIIEYIDNKTTVQELERTFMKGKLGEVVYQNKTPNTIFHHSKLPAPSYQGLPLNSYLSFLDVKNPMHRLWSDGRWNKLTVSHGCYWMQCSFCDVTLDYIGNYQNTTADDLVNKIEKLIDETGVTGFHFVDEAAPPKMLKALAETLIAREVYITWWTNIRFEKTFTPELCELLAKSGCIAVTGGLEVASDRLLAKMKKGVDIGQVARVTQAFADNNIMVHAYLMYGFPTQTEQETIDSLEVVRQLFENGCIHSAFWHLFTTTAHSPVGKNPEEFNIEITGPAFLGFAQNDLTHVDPAGAEHQKYSEGLNLALQNYLNGVGFDIPLQEWFGFDVPETTHHEHMISDYL